ncbi:repeat domain (List_Bact_rpt), partial [Butyrivibrio sp. ob235]|uniref:InlB B-repeat-containing protein n=1 Tax=Butyrivibrio sp. ob235 TaxID=1761780 RepID=UPI0008B07AAA
TQADGQGTTYEPGNTYTLTDEDDVLYAIWEDTLTYKANNGTGDESVTSGEIGESLIVEECTFNETRYTFVEWNTKDDGTGVSYKPNTSTYTLTDKEDVLYAIWEDTLSYDANGGEGTMEPTTGIAEGDVTISDNEFTREGYTFNGWNTVANPSDNDPGAAYNNGGTYRLTSGDDILYAQWAANYNVFYDAKGNGAVSNKEDTNLVQRTTDKIKGSTAIPDKGYRFVKWIKYGPETPENPMGTEIVVSDKEVLDATTIANNLNINPETELYEDTYFIAVFEESDEVYHVLYIGEKGGTASPGDQSDKLRSFENITGSTAIPEDGYEFEGWYKKVKNEDGSETLVKIEGAEQTLSKDLARDYLNKNEKNIDNAAGYTSGEPNAYYTTYEDTTFVAKFKAVIYNITYEYRLAEGVEKPANWDALVTELATHNRTAMSGEEFMCPDLPTVDGYTFGLWNMEKVAKETPSTLGKILNFFGDVADFITGKTDVRAESQKMIMPASDIVVYSIVTKNPEQLDPQPDPKPDPKPTPDDDDDDDDDDTPRRRRNTPGNNDNNNNDNNDNTGDPQVLGDKRNPADDKAVLGAKRDQEEEKKVLGARRGGTDDNTNTSRIIVLLIAAGAVATLLVTGKKRKEEEEQQ